MKLNNLKTNIGAALIFMFLAFASTGTVTAQSGTNGRSDNATTRTSDNDTDWGWLGLLGLGGLLGLLPKKRTADADRDVTSRTASSVSH
ncbi:MAG TPA: WGxxGxxG family protein [Pyrinomonadaceae bacterium]|nr:WGxxGxxG family protein [Pyrinomonadaceae bacterium]